MVPGIGVGDVGLGFLEVGLAKFNNRAETEVVTGLREVKGQASLLAEQASDGEAFVSTVGVLPGSAHVAGDVVAETGEALAIDVRLKIGGFGASAEKKTVEDRDVDIDADSAIPVGDVIVANRGFADDTEGADGGALEVVFGTAESLRGGNFGLEGSYFGSLGEGLLNERENVESRRNNGTLLFLHELKILLILETQDRGE